MKKDILNAFLITIIILVCGFVVVFGIVYTGQLIEKTTWGDYEYRVTQDEVYWYTNEYVESGNCISFTSNYNTSVNWCEKYMVEESYWKENNPNWKTVLFGY